MIYHIFTQDIVRALGWTVLHSLWQAALIAMALAGLQLALSRHSARLRYNLANASLLFVLALALGTFFYLYKGSAAQASLSLETLTTVGPVAFSEVPAPELKPQAAPAGWLVQSWGYFEEHLPLIVTLWLLGMVFFLLRLLGGLAYVQQLKRIRTQSLPEDWDLLLQELCARLRMKHPVQLLESAKVTTPIVVGHFKPVILLPIGVVNQLSIEQVEAVLAHELAHIVRHDYLWNVLQSLVEVLLYFNPAVWWITALIRNERENCCDDVAVELSGNSLVYARALVKLQEMQCTAPQMAMALTGRRLLLNRIKRILNQPQNKSNTMQKLAVTCLLLLLVGIMSIGASQPNAQDTESMVAIVSNVDSLPAGKIRLNVDHEGKKVEARLNEGKITYLKINDEEVPASKYQEYEDLVVDIMKDIPSPPSPPLPFDPIAPPMPPAPPSPPGVAPPAPGLDWATPPPPPARAPKALGGHNFSFHNYKNITTEKDKDGNTLIIIEAGPEEEPISIKVDGKTGAVIMDGAPLDEGRTALISEGLFSFQPSGDISWAESPEAHGGGRAFSWAESPEAPGRAFGWSLGELAELEALRGRLMDNKGRISAQARQEIERAMEDYRRAMGNYQRQYKNLSQKERREMDKAMREQEKDMQQMERELHQQALEMNVQQQEMREQALEMEHEARAMAESPVIWGQFDNGGIVTGDLQSLFEHELVKDGLVKDAGKYKLEISGNTLKINGKKQASSLHEKYKDLYQDFSGFQLSDKSRIVIDKK